MPIIKRYLSEEHLDRFCNDLKNLVKIVKSSKGELAIAIRQSYLNVYYKGNSLAKISFGRSGKYSVNIHKKFFEDTVADNREFYDEKNVSKYGYISLTLSEAKPLFRFLQKKHINQFCSNIKKVNYGEEITFEQALITDNLERQDLIIIDRQITDKELKRKQMDLLALKQIKSRRYRFLVLEVKLGNNPELKKEVSTQLDGYVRHMDKHFDDYKDCYEKQFEQKRQMGLIETPSFYSIQIEKPVEGMVVVGGYSKIAENSIAHLHGQYPHFEVKQFRYKL